MDVAYYLIHGMGRGGDGDFAQREQVAARNFARMAKREGIRQVVYLGGLGEPRSKHLRSRHETAGTLAAEGPPLTYFRAAMVVGAGSESFRTLYHLADRLPVMIAPAWLRIRSQPIGIEDVLAYLRAVPRPPASMDREVRGGRSWDWHVGPVWLRHRVAPLPEGAMIAVDIRAPFPLERLLAGDGRADRGRRLGDDRRGGRRVAGQAPPAGYCGGDVGEVAAMLIASQGLSGRPRQVAIKAAACTATSRAPRPRTATAAGGSPPAGPSHARVTRRGAASSAAP